MNKRHFLLLLAVVLILQLGASHAHAGLILDQSYMDGPGSNFSAFVWRSTSFSPPLNLVEAQTFAAGANGILHSVSVNVGEQAGSTSLTLEVYSGGLPAMPWSSTPGASASLPSSAIPGSPALVSFDVSSSALNIVSGNTYTILLRSLTTPNGYYWVGEQGGTYGGGGAFQAQYRDGGGSFTGWNNVFSNPSSDFFFQTFNIPEPSTLVFLACGLGALALTIRRKRRRTASA